MSIQFTENYNALINKAAAISRHEGKKLIERRHLFFAVCQTSPKMFNRLLKCRQLVYPQQQPCAESKDEPVGILRFSKDAYRVLSVQGGCLGEVVAAVGMSPIDVQHVAAALLFDKDEKGPVKELLYANGIELQSERQTIIDTVKSLCASQAKNLASDMLSKVSAVRKALKEMLIGQDDIIDKICTTLLEFWCTPVQERTRPLSIFIAGMPGSGKTLLANTLSSTIAKLNGANPIATLNAGMYSTTDSSRDIVGLDSSWKGPKPGAFTLPILENPEGVICLDNIDTLHIIGLNHILKAITVGSLKDEFLGKMIDFRNAICIFTSYAGGECVSQATLATAQALSTRHRLAEELCAGIQSLEAQRNVRAMVEQCTLPILMKPLEVQGLRTLMFNSIEHEFNNLKNTVKSIVIDKDEVADLLVQTIESLDPRSISSIVGGIIEPIRNQMINSPEVWRNLKALKVVVEGAKPLDPKHVSDNLHMRKRMTVKVSIDYEDKEATLHIAAAGYVMLPAIKDGIVKVTPPSASDTFDKLVGIDAPLKYANRWKLYFSGKLKTMPEHLILVGPPGCGKTAFVRALAADLQKPYVILNCNDLESPTTIINVFKTIRKYARDGLLVFLDEIDSVAADRDGKSESYIERLDTLLQQMDGFLQAPTAKVLYLAATNRIFTLDNAMLRSGRFGQTISFSPLGEDERHQLVKLAADEYKANIDQNLEDFIVETTEGLTPATVKATIREMSFSSEKTVFSKEEYLKARQAILLGICTRQAELTDEEEYAVACHESGHALCAELNNRQFHQVSIVSNGDTLGYIEQRKPGMLSSTKEGLLASIDILLAGRAAQDIVLGQPTDGAISDIERATKTALHYVKSGYSDYGICIPPDGIEWSEISSIIRKTLDERYNLVKKQLSKEKGVLQELTKLLLKKKIVFQDELRELRKGYLNPSCSSLDSTQNM